MSIRPAICPPKQVHGNFSVFDEADDNRVYAKQIVRALRSDSPPRELLTQFFVWRVSDLNPVAQTFSVLINLQVSFQETDPAFKNAILSTTAEEANGIKSVFRKPGWKRGDFPWVPAVRVFNCIEEKQHEEWWRVTTGDFSKSLWPGEDRTLFDQNAEQVWVHHNMRLQLVLEECWELQNFPFDLQQLHITLTTQHPYSHSSFWKNMDTHKDYGLPKTAVMRFSQRQASSVSNTGFVSQTYAMHPPRLIAYDSDWTVNDLPLLSRASESRTGCQYSRLHIALVIERHSGYVMWNVVSMHSLILASSLSAYAIAPAEVANRTNVPITLILAAAAFKLVTTSMLPGKLIMPVVRAKSR